jgi:hypothetical protein
MKIAQKRYYSKHTSSYRKAKYFKKKTDCIGTKSRPTPEQKNKWVNLKKELCTLMPDPHKHAAIWEAKTGLELVLLIELITPKMFKAAQWYACLCHFNTIGASHRSRSLQEELRNPLTLKFVSEQDIESADPYERQWRKTTQLLTQEKLREIVELIACKDDEAALKFLLTCAVSQKAFCQGLDLLTRYFEQDPLLV